MPYWPMDPFPAPVIEMNLTLQEILNKIEAHFPSLTQSLGLSLEDIPHHPTTQAVITILQKIDYYLGFFEANCIPTNSLFIDTDEQLDYHNPGSTADVYSGFSQTGPCAVKILQKKQEPLQHALQVAQTLEEGHAIYILSSVLPDCKFHGFFITPENNLAICMHKIEESFELTTDNPYINNLTLTDFTYKLHTIYNKGYSFIPDTTQVLVKPTGEIGFIDVQLLPLIDGNIVEGYYNHRGIILKTIVTKPTMATWHRENLLTIISKLEHS